MKYNTIFHCIFSVFTILAFCKIKVISTLYRVQFQFLNFYSWRVWEVSGSVPSVLKLHDDMPWCGCFFSVTVLGCLGAQSGNTLSLFLGNFLILILLRFSPFQFLFFSFWKLLLFKQSSFAVCAFELFPLLFFPLKLIISFPFREGIWWLFVYGEFVFNWWTLQTFCEASNTNYINM